MGRLERHLDLDAIDRVKRGVKPHSEPQGIKQVKPPRAASTYRAARRNEVLRTSPRGAWRGAKPNGAVYRRPVRANRSRKWAPFKGRLYGEGSH